MKGKTNIIVNQLKSILATTLIIIVFMIAMPMFVMGSNISQKDVEGESVVEEAAVEASTKKTNIMINGNSTVKVYITETDKIVEVPLEEYICGVVSNEMPANFEKEALKAQAVAARTYLASKKNRGCSLHENVDICDSTHCQVYTSKEDRLSKWDESCAEDYWNKIKEAVDETSGQVLSYEGELVLYPQFFSTSSGQTENSEDVFSGDIPYLKSVSSIGEEEAPKYTSEKKYSLEDFVYLLNNNFSNLNATVENIKEKFKVKSKSEAGGVMTLEINNVEVKGTDFRKAVLLNSTNFTYEFIDNNIVFYCKGYGHGVGMSQWGANAMAKNGSGYDEILKHYYTGVEITNLEFTE